MSLTKLPGIMNLFPARESLNSEILAGDGKIVNIFLQCMITFLLTFFTVYAYLNYFFSADGDYPSEPGEGLEFPPFGEEAAQLRLGQVCDTSPTNIRSSFLLHSF